MAGTTPVSGAPIPEDSDDFDTALDMAALGAALDPYVLGRFTTTGNRDTAIPSPARGQGVTICASNGSILYVYGYNGTDWRVLATSRVGGTMLRNTAQGKSTGSSGTAITWNSTEDNSHLQGASGSGITVPIAGRYKLEASCVWDSNSTGLRQIQLTLNGSGISGTGRILPAISGFSTTVATSRTIVLAAGDTISATCWQTSGSGLDVTSAVLSVDLVGV